MKRTMTIEDAVRWAYRDELPKADAALSERLGPRGYGSGSVAANTARDYWCVPDNVFGLVPVEGASDQPHSDAVRIHEAVRALDDVPVVVNEAWTMADLEDLGAAVREAVSRAIDAETIGVGEHRRLRRPLSGIVFKAAIIGLDEGHLVERPEVRPVTEYGKAKWFRQHLIVSEEGSFPVEVDGMDRRRRMPYPDAYQKFVLVPDPMAVFCDRAVWQVWRGAMDVLHACLDGRLETIDVTPCSASWAPWRRAPAVDRVLTDTSALRRGESRGCRDKRAGA